MKMCLMKNELYPPHLYIYNTLAMGCYLYNEVDKEVWEIRMYFPTLQSPVNHATEDTFSLYTQNRDNFPLFF